MNLLRYAFPSQRLLRLTKESTWIVLGQFAAILGSFLGIRILTGLLSPGQWGELALGLTVGTIVNQVLLAPLGNGAARFYAAASESQELGSFLYAVSRLTRAATLGTLLLMLCVIAALFGGGRSHWVPICIGAFILSILSGYNAILIGLQTAARHRSIVAFHQGMESWLRFLLAADLIFIFGASSSAAMFGYVAGVTLVLGSQYLFYQRAIQTPLAPVNERLWRQRIWQYSWPFASWGLFSWGQQSSDRWALEVFGSTHDVGLYSVLFQLSYSPIVAATAVAMQFLAPIFYQRAGDATDRQRVENVHHLSWRLTWVTMAATGLVFLLSFIAHPWIFRLFVAREYGVISHLMPWMVLAGGFFAAGQGTALNLMSRLETRSMTVAKVGTSIFGILANLVGAYSFGLSGVVSATVISAVVYFIWMVVLAESKRGSIGTN